jgi:hypothetical protein
MPFKRGKPGLVGELIQASGAGCLGTGIWLHPAFELRLIHQEIETNACARRRMSNRRG